MSKARFFRDRPEAQGVFLAVLRETRTVTAAALAAGIGDGAAQRLRVTDPAFARGWAAALADGDGGRAVRSKITSSQRETFVAALAHGKGIARAAALAKVTADAAFSLRRRDASFARRWAEARTVALELAEDELLRRALDGFVRVETRDGIERRVVTQEWRPLLALLARRLPGDTGGRYKTIELTPEVVAQARAKVTRMLTLRGGHAWSDAETVPATLAAPGTQAHPGDATAIDPAAPDTPQIDDSGADGAAVRDFAALRDDAA